MLNRKNISKRPKPLSHWFFVFLAVVVVVVVAVIAWYVIAAITAYAQSSIVLVNNHGQPRSGVEQLTITNRA